MTPRRPLARPLAALLVTTACAWWCARAADEATPAQPTQPPPAQPQPTQPKPQPERPFTPGGVYRQGDMNRPQPAVIDPGTASTPETPGRPPSDAVVLFGGTDLSQWVVQGGKNKGQPAAWKVENGEMVIVPGSGSIVTKERFADAQIHLEWATPTPPKGNSQGRGNSGFFLDGHAEVQVLDSYENKTYPDGQAGAIYSQFPPLVNASRPPGEWQTYDIIYQAPKLTDGKVTEPARYTVFHNGVLVQHYAPVPGNVVECTISLQDHGNPIRYRNIWVRRLRGYDQLPPADAPQTNGQP